MYLRAQLDLLDRFLLSNVTTQFPDALTDEEKVAVNAYLVLSHAAIEEHIEQVFENHFDRLLGWLKYDGLVPSEAARLALAIGEWLPDNLRVPYAKRELAGQVLAARNHLAARIKLNHGLKDSNVQDMAKLLGVDWKTLDATLSTQLQDLNTLASKRGEAGHLSPFTERAVKLTRQDYPDDVRTWVGSAGEAAISIEKYLADLLSTQQPRTLICDWDGN